MAGGPLEGVRVIDLTSVVVGPLCTRILADYGADVIKVESPGGDLGRNIGGRGRTENMGPKFLHLNRNKRSVVLDLKKPAGYEALMRLVAGADVLLWNVRPDSMQRMKLAYDLYYVQRRSLFLDLLILVATVRVVLFQEGSR